MLASIDLTSRQAARVLEQAIRTRVTVQIEPRSREGSISGSFAGRQQDLLSVELHDIGSDWSLGGLIGVFCEVRMTLSGQIYLFTACILDAVEDRAAQRLLLAPPEIVQVANRRCFERVVPSNEVTVQLWPPGASQPVQGMLNNVSAAGLGCRMPRREVDETLLIDDEVRVSFELPRAGEAFKVAAVVCVKTRAPTSDHLDVGLEFLEEQPRDGSAQVLERLKAVLAHWNAGDTASGGGA